MNIQPEFEQEEKGGRWIAKIPGVREVVGYGSTPHEAAVGLTVRALHVLADRVESGQIEVEEEPVRIFVAGAEKEVSRILVEFLAGLKEGLPESFLSGWVDYEAGRVVEMDRALGDEAPPPVVV